MTGGWAGVSTAVTAILLLYGAAFSQAPPDSAKSDSAIIITPADTSRSGDSLAPFRPAGALPKDTAYQATKTPAQPVEKWPAPIRMLDTLTRYFAGSTYRFDVHDYDLYPRNAAEFLAHDAAYFVMTYHESPLRTTAAPFGLPAGQVPVQSGANPIRPYDRTVPADGRTDYDDVATGDVAAARMVEGPLSGFPSLEGGLSLLYLEPSGLPTDEARSEFTVERGAYGYAYTRARFGRMFSRRWGFSMSTDYRKADDLETAIDDDSYHIISYLLHNFDRRTTLDLYLNIYRRRGAYPVEPDSGGFSFRRLRFDQQAAVSVTRQELGGGQLTGRFDYQASKSAYSAHGSAFFRTLKPTFYQGDLTYLLGRSPALWQFSLGGGEDRNRINLVEERRRYGYALWAASFDRRAGRFFGFVRMRAAEKEQIVYEGAIGLLREISSRWRARISIGQLGRWPDLAERYAPERIGVIGYGPLEGTFSEKGNPGLDAEKRLTGNAAITYQDSRVTMSAALNAGVIKDLIYYDRRYGTYPAEEVSPMNDHVKYANMNLSAAIDTLGPFFVTVSASARRVDSDRYGNRPPLSPRWQVYSRAGARYYVKKYELHLRLFGDITFAERPLSYKLEKLNTTAVVTGGFNASLKALTFYYLIHDFTNRVNQQPEGYGYSGWFYSWGINWKFID